MMLQTGSRFRVIVYGTSHNYLVSAPAGSGSFYALNSISSATALAMRYE